MFPEKNQNKKSFINPKKLIIESDKDGKTNFNRYWMIPPAILNHLCLGSVFAWSIFNDPLTKLNGVLASAASDWALTDIMLTFSLIMGGFAWGAIFGRYLDKFGPRISCLIGAASLGGGFGCLALATHYQSLPALYLGGLIWGLANGWAYVPPVSTLIKWFPDKKGFASGACLVGYGGGAMIAAPMFTKMLEKFRTIPDYLGSVSSQKLTTIDGKQFCDIGGELKEVIVTTAADVNALGLQEGIYVVGTGSTGATETFLILGTIYSLIMSISSFAYRLPDERYSKNFAKNNITKDKAPMPITKHNVDVSTASKTKQFWLMWSGFGLAITGSYGILSCGKTLLVDVFERAYPEIVTAAFAATFVALISASNLGGRIFWSSLSDYFVRTNGKDPFFGRKRAFTFMWSLAPLLYLLLIWSIHQTEKNDDSNDEELSILPLIGFSIAVFGVISIFGGTAASRPAFTGDLFGTKNVGAITARQLSVVLPASYIGPKIATTLRETSIKESTIELCTKVDNSVFYNAFGVDKSQIPLLLEQNSLTINRVLELCPPGTIDPTPFVYDNTMYIMAGLQSLALLSNFIMKPVDSKHHIKEDDDNQENPITETTNEKEK